MLISICRIGSLNSNFLSYLSCREKDSAANKLRFPEHFRNPGKRKILTYVILCIYFRLFFPNVFSKPDTYLFHIHNSISLLVRKKGGEGVEKKTHTFIKYRKPVSSLFTYHFSPTEQASLNCSAPEQCW